jgi:hypothetical protein
MQSETGHQAIHQCSKTLGDLESKRQRENQKWKQKPERGKQNEARNESWATAGWDRKGEDDSHFTESPEATASQIHEKQFYPLS